MLPTAIPPKQHKHRRPLTEHPGKTCEGFREERVHSKAAEKSKHFTTNWIFYHLLWLYSLLLKWSFSQVFILFLPFRKLKNPWAKSVLNLCKPEFPKQMKESRVGRSWGGEKEKERGRERRRREGESEKKGGKREKGSEGGRKKGRKKKGEKIWRHFLHFILTCLHHMLLTISPEATVGKMTQPQMFRTSGLQPENFHSIHGG